MPTTRKKVLLVEEDNIELDRKTETRMEADNIFIDDSIVQLGADNIQDAVLALKQTNDNQDNSLKIAQCISIPGNGIKLLSYDTLHNMFNDSMDTIINLKLEVCE